MRVGDLVRLTASPKPGMISIYPTKIKDGSIGILLKHHFGISRHDCLVNWGDTTEWVFRGRLEVVNEHRRFG